MVKHDERPSMIELFPNPTWLIGCGNMTGAMVDGWRAAGIDFSSTVVVRPSGTTVEGLRVVTALSEAGAPPRMMLLGFKPQKLPELAPDLACWVTSRTTIVSLLAGTEAASLRRRFPNAGAIVRAMPNLPVAIRRGVTGLYSEDAQGTEREKIGALFAALGVAAWVPDEVKYGAIGNIAGSGPAYVARFIAALTGAGTDFGLDPQLAGTIALETVLGTAWMAASKPEPMDSLARRVASPNGTTEAGLAVLDAENGLEAVVRAAVEAAAERGAELAEQARLA
jgi:pyrroline-5-carboxylate reductase